MSRSAYALVRPKWRKLSSEVEILGKASRKYEKIYPTLVRALQSEQTIRGGGLFGRIILTVVHATWMFLAQPRDSHLPLDLRGSRCCEPFEGDIPTLCHTCAGYLWIYLGAGGVDKGDGDRSKIAQHSRG